MRIGGFLFLYLSVICLAACSDPMRFRAVNGEVFMMPCENWSRVESHKLNTRSVTKKSVATFKAEATDSGNYTCLTRGGRRILYLQVVNKTIGCSSAEENRVTLWLGKGGNITCPGHNCSHSTTTVWYKGNKDVSKLRRRLSVKGGQLRLNEVDKSDNAEFFCDRELSESGLTWTMRRSVTVKAIDPEEYRPRITSPENNLVQEVELGTNHTLRCVVHFPEADMGDVRWFTNSSGRLVNLKIEDLKIEPKVEVQVTAKATLRKVTSQDLNRTYTCIANNTSGKNSSSVFLKKKNKVQWSSLVEYALGPLVVVTGLTIVLRVKWLDIQLILKSRMTFSKTKVGSKDFDVLLSFVWTTSSLELVSPPLRHTSEKGAFPFSLAPLAVEIPSERPELLLPHVLEDKWGYRLCLMERDYLPGGAYTNDVANAIQRSQMMICLLSDEYLSNNNAVFVLESGVKALLQNSGIKMLLIWTNTAQISPMHLDPPLPVVVQKAIKVLPALKWTSAKNTNFWRHLKKAMPHQRVSSQSKSS